jgi:hypothetical protein
MNDQTRDERLRRLLREADPAADDPGLSLEEVREMRRTVLSAVPELRRQWGLLPILAGTAVAILMLVLGLMLRPGSLPAAPREPQQVATVPRTFPAPVSEAPAQTETPTVRVPQEKTVQTAEVPRRRPARRRPSGHRVAVPAPTVIAEAETHQIQFSTPGGTRIIWVLSSDKVSEETR